MLPRTLHESSLSIISFHILTSLVHAKRNNVRVDHAKVERREEHISVRQSNEARTVDDGSTIGVDRGVRLVRVPGVGARDDQGSVGHVELSNPRDEGRLAGDTALGRDVAVVGSDGLAGSVPLEEDLLAGEGEGLRAVVADGGAAAVAGLVQVDAALVLGGDGGRAGRAVVGALPEAGVVGRDTVDVRLVGHVQGREVLPCEACGILRAGADVGCEESPGPRLRDTGLEPHGHGVQAGHLAEDHLLAAFGSDGLGEELANLARVEVVDEAPHTRLTPAGEDLVEVDKLAGVGERVVVGALRRRGLAEHVAQEGGVALLLLSHERDQRHVLRGETSGCPVLVGEGRNAVVEQVELNPLLVKTQGDGLVVEVTLDHVARQRTVCSETASWGVGDRLVMLELAVRVVVRLCRGERKRRDCRGEVYRAHSASGCWHAAVGAMGCRAGGQRAALGIGRVESRCWRKGLDGRDGRI